MTEMTQVISGLITLYLAILGLLIMIDGAIYGQPTMSKNFIKSSFSLLSKLIKGVLLLPFRMILGSRKKKRKKRRS